ncbi:hypothetical protein [Lewinella cohaerens]|uniref:hypothetical protein n=1 Tax=Lewinella cohaerens TaxID=70995 RepID=UPI00036A3B5C|nr:hypothetical protein [Lewinella cohaerens]
MANDTKISASTVSLRNCGEFRAKFRAIWEEERAGTEWTKFFGSSGDEGQIRTLDLKKFGIPEGTDVAIQVHVEGGGHDSSNSFTYNSSGGGAYFLVSGLTISWKPIIGPRDKDNGCG